MKILSTVSALALSAAGAAQVSQIQLDPPEGTDYGKPIERIGDVDGDGFTDFGLAHPSNTGGVGKVWIISGRTLQALDTATGRGAAAAFGTGLTHFDSNADGRFELLTGSPGFSGSISGEGEIYHWHYDSQGQFYWNWRLLRGSQIGLTGIGRRIASAPYFDEDGRGDLVFTSDTHVVAGTIDGALAGPQSHTFRELWRFAPPERVDALEVIGDYNGDGFDDVVLGMPNYLQGSGRVEIRSGRDGSLIDSVDGIPGHLLGLSVAGLGDVNDDGRADFAYGVPFADSPFGIGVTLRVVNGLPGTPVSNPVVRIGYGFALSGDGDYNGDGIRDLMVGQLVSDVVTIDGSTGQLLTTTSGNPTDFGAAVGLFDLNGNPFHSPVISEPETGTVYVYTRSASLPNPPSSYPYGRVCSGASMPRCSTSLYPRVDGPMDVRVDAAPISSPAFVILGARTSWPLGSVGVSAGCEVHTSALAVLAATTSASGSGKMSLSVPNLPGFAGLEVSAQWLVIDSSTAGPSSPAKVAVSNSVMMRIGSRNPMNP